MLRPLVTTPASRARGFRIVFALVAVSATFQLAVTDSEWTRVVTALLQSAALIASLWVVGYPRPLVVAAGAVSIGAVARTCGHGRRRADTGRAPAGARSAARPGIRQRSAAATRPAITSATVCAPGPMVIV